jgi:hypothetical protein
MLFLDRYATWLGTGTGTVSLQLVKTEYKELEGVYRIGWAGLTQRVWHETHRLEVGYLLSLWWQIYRTLLLVQRYKHRR